MCGIVGVLNFQREEKVSASLIEKMLSSIYHRGPDEQGAYLNGGFGMGNARLGIIDLLTGQQPLCDASGRYWIAYNGEVFNYIELRKEIEAKGYHFKTTSDTEVIVAAFSLWGKHSLVKLNGQFAFAIYDKEQKHLFLARDRVGICPLFYSIKNGRLIFGSEVKAILQHPEIYPKISIEALMQLFTFWATLQPNTIFENIYQVPPGHFLEFKAGKFVIEPYWTLRFPERGTISSFSFQQAQNKLNEIMEDAVRIRLRADVPVAAYLSGGLDSSAIVSYIKNVEDAELTTFSIGFNNKDFDESHYQNLVANHLGTKHKNIMFSEEQIPDLFEKVIWHAESPMLRSSSVPMYVLSRFVRDNNIKVVVTGEGSDEMLAGYDIFKEMLIRRFWARQPQSKYRPLLLKKLYPYIPQIQNASTLQLRFFYAFNLENVHLPYYSHIIRWNNGKHLLRYLHDQHKQELEKFDPFGSWEKLQPQGFSRWSNLDKAQYIESNLFLSGYLLSSQGDRMTMANSVEGRYPFLDHRFIEFASQLPSDFKIKGLNEKYILKKALENKLPKAVLNRPKQAYRAPVGDCFFNTQNDKIKYLLDLKTISDFGIFKPELCNELFKKIKYSKSGSEIENMALLSIISTQMFYDLFLNSKSKINNSNKMSNLRVIDETPSYSLASIEA